MSYILDAIKKSEAERGHGSIPGLQTVHSSSLNYKTDNKQLWPYILIGLLLLNFAGLIYYFTNANKNEALSEPISNQTNTTQAVTRTDSTRLTNTVAQAIPRTTPTAQQPSKAAPQPVKSEPIKTIYVAEKVEIMQPTADREVIDIEELPEKIKQQIPTMKFTGHVYSSSPVQRSIIINGSFMEEGDDINSEVTLTEITSRGAIFNFEDIFFEVNVLTGWNVNQ